LVEASTSDHSVDVHAINLTSEAISSSWIIGCPLAEHHDHDGIVSIVLIGEIGHS
jgi:hypothetical protein